jgi:hypothetical protein
MEEPPFVQLKFELDGADLIVRFYAPAKAAGGEFLCVWTIAWPERETRRRAHGDDSVQALMLAMRSAHWDLGESSAYKSERLTLHGQRDLDLPPDWGTGPLYQVPPPSGSAA